MAMIDAYRIGVELVLGGDLAAGIESLIPGLERLDAGIAHANAEAGELAAGLREVAETAPGIGQAADQLGRLSSAMANVNLAVEAWRLHGGGPEVGVSGQVVDHIGTRPHPATAPGYRAELERNSPDPVADFNVGEENGHHSLPSIRSPSGAGLPGGMPDPTSRLNAGERTHRGFDAVIPALAAGELIKDRPAGWFDGGAKDAEALTGRIPPDRVLPVGALAPNSKISTPAGDAAKGVEEVYASAAEVLLDYVRSALATGGSVRESREASIEPVRSHDWRNAIQPSGHGPDRARVREVEEVLPALSRTGLLVTSAEMPVEPQQVAQPSIPILPRALPSMVGVRDVEMPILERGTGFYPTLNNASLSVDPGLAPAATGSAISEHERPARRGAGAANHAVATVANEAVPGLRAATSHAAAKWLGAVSGWFEGDLGGMEKSLRGLSTSLAALSVPHVKEGPVGLRGGSLFAMTTGTGALNGVMGKTPGGWPGATQRAAAVGAEAPGAMGGGFAHSLTAPYHERGGGMGATPHLQGFHPQGGQPGPVIQHVTYIHLDDREIARAVTRQQLRMMGGNVSGTLRPDPSIAPHYGAHLLET